MSEIHDAQAAEIARLTTALAEANAARKAWRGERNNLADENTALHAQNARLRRALNWIAVTFTEDSHGNMKTLAASDYQAHARAALAGEKEPT